MSNWTGEKLRRYLVVNEVSPETLAPKVGRTRGTIYNWMGQKTFDEEQIGLLKKAGIDLDISTMSSVSHETGKLIPFYNVSASAGAKEMYDDEGEEIIGYGAVPGLEDCQFGLRVWGDSMWRTYKNGQFVICKEITDFDIIPYGQCFLIRTAELRMVKRVLKSKYKGYILASSDNEEMTKDGVKIYESIEIPKAKIKKLWLIRGHAGIDSM